MKKSFLVFILVAISFLLLGQEKESEAFSVETEAPFKFVSQEFKGSVEQVDEFMKEFMKNFFDQQLTPNGQPMAIFHNEPKSADDRELMFEIGFPVGTKDDVNVKPPLKVQEIQLPAVMKHVHTGRYEELFGVYEKLRGMVRQSGSEWGKGFTIHRFLNNPEYVKPEEVKTEVIVPLQEPSMQTSRLTAVKKTKTPRLKVGESINYTVMYKSYRGSVDQIDDFVQDFLKEFFAENRTPMGQPMIIFSNVPNSPKDKGLKMDIGFPVPEKDQGELKSYRVEKGVKPSLKARGVKSSLKVRKVQMDNVAKLEHIGPYAKIFDAHQEMVKELQRQSFQTSNTQAILILLNNPALVKPEEIRAKIIIPAGK